MAVSSVRWRRAAEFLALERAVALAAGAMFLLALGEHLWRRFLPKYLAALGAPVTAIGLFGTAEDFLDGVYQYPGGWAADRFGRAPALRLFVALAAVGYALYRLAPAVGWPLVFLGLAFAAAWSSMASPALFAVVGDALPRERRAMGFTVQAILRRVPIVVAPTLGGLLIAERGVVGGVRAGLAAAMAMAVVTLALLTRLRLTPAATAGHERARVRDVWRAFPPPLRWLLASDVFVRTCEGLVDVFLVLYAIDVVGVTAPAFGVLVAVQTVTSIVCYLPAARLADRVGRKPFVVATFVAFALFPLCVVHARGVGALALAFVVGGLREIGEPSRKALIVDLARPALRARTVGLYYLLRSLAVAPAAFVGGLLWRHAPALPFYVAALVGCIGVLVFVSTVEEEWAG